MDFSSIFQWAGEALGGLGGDIGSYLAGAFSVIANNFTSVGNLFGSLASWAWNAIQAIVGWIGSFIDWLRKHIIDPIIAKITAIVNRIHGWLQPLIDWIQRERAFLLAFWNQYIKPLLNFIQRLRRALQVFRLLGFKWAQRLDSYLAKLEADIQQAFFGVWRNLNILSEWVNFIVDPFGQIQPSLMVGSVIRSVGAIYGAIWAAQNLPLGASALAQQDALASSYTASAVRQGLHLRAASGSQPEDTDNLAAVQAQWAALGIVT